MQELKTEETIEKLIDMISEFGDGPLEFETRDVNCVLNQLTLQENYNDMLVTECEDLKSAVVVAEEQRDRLQANLIDKEEVNAELRQTIIALQQRQIRLENMLADHQELSQWIEEQIDNDPDTRIYEVSHDFLEILYDKVHKINH
jgi:Cft2 family RNA processing exonuclease